MLITQPASFSTSLLFPSLTISWYEFLAHVLILLFLSCRFNVVAYLQQIWWFEVDGAVTFPFPPDIYTLSFRIHLGRFSRRLGRRISHFDHTHGWDIKPVRFKLSTSDGQQASSECYLDDAPQNDANGSFKRGCWIEYKVGQFLVRESDPPTEVRFSMKQIDCTHSKGGLCVDSVLIMPSEMKECRRRGALKWRMVCMVALCLMHTLHLGCRYDNPLSM